MYDAHADQVLAHNKLFSVCDVDSTYYCTDIILMLIIVGLITRRIFE